MRQIHSSDLIGACATDFFVLGGTGLGLLLSLGFRLRVVAAWSGRFGRLRAGKIGKEGVGCGEFGHLAAGEVEVSEDGVFASIEPLLMTMRTHVEAPLLIAAFAGDPQAFAVL